MRRFLERHMARQLPELVPADDQLTGLAVHVAEARLGGDDTIKTARPGIRAHVTGRRRAAKGGKNMNLARKWSCSVPRIVYQGTWRHTNGFLAWQECHKLVLAVYK